MLGALVGGVATEVLAGVVVGGLATAGAWALTTARRSDSYRVYMSGNALQTLLGIPRRERVLIVVPTWRQVSVETQQESVAAWEDMMAASAIETSLVAAGWRYQDIQIVLANRFKRSHRREHLVLVGSPHRNFVAEEALQQIDDCNCLEFPFRQRQDGSDQRFLQLDDHRPYYSQSYAEEEQIQLDHPGDNPYDHGPLTDYALLTRFVNPWDPSKRVLIASGIRAFGTYGAACALRDGCVELAKRTKGKSFAVVARVELEAYQIVRCEFLGPHKEIRQQATA